MLLLFMLPLLEEISSLSLQIPLAAKRIGLSLIS
jgi:hypothetical protein